MIMFYMLFFHVFFFIYKSCILEDRKWSLMYVICYELVGTVHSDKWMVNNGIPFPPDHKPYQGFTLSLCTVPNVSIQSGWRRTWKVIGLQVLLLYIILIVSFWLCFPLAGYRYTEEKMKEDAKRDVSQALCNYSKYSSKINYSYSYLSIK